MGWTQINMGKKREKSVSELISEALFTLIVDEKRDYNQLSIQDIITKAGVCRNSFYRNFKNIDEILMKNLENVWENTDLEESDIPYGDGVEKVMFCYFTVLQQNERVYKAFYLANPGRYFDYFSKSIIRANTHLDIETLDPSEYYRYACRAWIGVGIMTEWLFRGFDLPIEEMIAQLMEVYKDW